MGERTRRILKPLASLRLTVVLLVLGMVLVFLGTLAQRSMGIWSVQKEYFHSFIVWRHGLPLPGGYSVGGLMLINLLAAHAVRFKLAWGRAGIILVHSGIILLLVGELVTSLFAVEMQMPILQGQTISYAQDIRESELALIDTSAADHDRVVAVPQSLLRPGQIVHHQLVPLDLRIERFMANSEIVGPMQNVPGAVRLADQGNGARLGVVELPDETDAERVNVPSALVTVMAEGQKLGTWLASLHLGPQVIEHQGKAYILTLRFRRHYKPFTVQLLKFTHRKYPGTEIPAEFSSSVRLIDPRHREDRQTLISMNAPLRYDGKTFYQASFMEGDRGTVLQVVDNPGVWLPYISCTMVSLGMTVHFVVMLLRYLKRAPA